jgi:hypothetical protein
VTRARGAARSFFNLVAAGLVVARAFGAEPDEGVRRTLTGASCGGAGPDTLDIVWVKLPNEKALTVAACDWLRDEKWRVRFERASAVPPARNAAPRSGEAHGVRLVVALDSPERARLYVDLPSGRRWVRDVQIEAGFGDASVEAIAQALHSVAQATDASDDPPGDASSEARLAVRSPLSPRQGTPPTRASASPAAKAPARLENPQRASLEPIADRSPPLPGGPAARASGAEAATPGAGNVLPSRDAATPSNARHAPASGRPVSVLTGLGYLMFLRGEEPLLHGPVLRVELDGAAGAASLGGYFNGVLFTSAEKQLPLLVVQTSGVSLGAGVSLRSSFSELGIRAGLGGGVDLVTLDTVVRDPTALRLLPDRRARPRGFLSGDIAGTYRLGAVELELAALLRWQLLHTSYQARDGDEVLVLFEPWRLQPGLSAGAAYVW